MASPTSSSSSSIPPFRPSSSLPVMALREKIVEKIQENRVTLIVGDTGCGKSSQVPQFLVEENVHPIVCTQPRRFAVVAIAKMVAKARNCEVGGEVGYHIGHCKVMIPESKIVFKTAGVLLDEMLDKGFTALQQYKVIILDEVHERSVESDLVLACVKQFMMRDVSLRVVLMSATADIARYRDYFKGLGRGERVEVLAIPSSSQQTIFQRKVLYLEQVTDLLGEKSDFLSATYCSESSSLFADTEIKLELQNLIRDLVLHIHDNEPNIEKSILVFLPTYYALEQQWSLLMSNNLSLKVHILHSSIDIEKALLAMTISKFGRKVILATNIAESSVTIPGVAFVIDSCRSLQVFWDPNRKKDSSELVWVSKSQAEQRKGRTGRTCDGQIYRLVTRSFYNRLSDHERPSILRLSLRQQVLSICSSDSKAINDPKVLLQRTLDPPYPEVVEDALSLLVHIHALEKPVPPRLRYEPTFYGRMLASLRLSFDASVVILKFGEMGLIREGILVGILVDVQPLPILRPFGDDILFAEYLDSYFEGKSDGNGSLRFGKKEMVLMANLCAFQFWQRVFKDKHRLERLKQTIKVNDETNLTQSLVCKLEEEWCHFHNLVVTSLRHVSDIYEDILNVIHRFRPHFFSTTDGAPSYYDPYEFKHTCLLQSASTVDADVETMSCCLASPFVASEDFQTKIVAEKLVSIIKEMRVQFTSGDGHPNKNGLVSHSMDEHVLCRFFIKGSCMRGSQCFFSHSFEGKRPVCKFFFSLQGCRNGDSCFFSHDEGPTNSSYNSPSFCLPEDEVATTPSLLQLLSTNSDEGTLLLLDDTHLRFSSNLSYYCNVTKIIATTSQPCCPLSKAPPAGVTVTWGVSVPHQFIIATEGKNSIPWGNVKWVLWFAEFHDYEEDQDKQHLFVFKFFEFLAIRLLADTLYDVRVILTMNNTKFSQLQVEKLARECFFFLTESFAFDETTFGKFSGQKTTNKLMQVSRPISYVFDLHPPTDIQFGDYSSTLYKGIHKDQ